MSVFNILIQHIQLEVSVVGGFLLAFGTVVWDWLFKPRIIITWNDDSKLLLKMQEFKRICEAGGTLSLAEFLASACEVRAAYRHMCAHSLLGWLDGSIGQRVWFRAPNGTMVQLHLIYDG